MKNLRISEVIAIFAFQAIPAGLSVLWLVWSFKNLSDNSFRLDLNMVLALSIFFVIRAGVGVLYQPFNRKAMSFLLLLFWLFCWSIALSELKYTASFLPIIAWMTFCMIILRISKEVAWRFNPQIAEAKAELNKLKGEIEDRYAGYD